MGLAIGGTNNSNVRSITLKNADGTAAGTISITKPKTGKKKKLQYNFKEISTQLMRTRSAGGARQVASKARGIVAMLRKKMKTGEYDDKELEAAIEHAKQMEKVAKKRAKHLQEEQGIKEKGGGGVCAAELEENEDLDWDAIENQESIEPEIDMEELKELMQEFQELMQDTMEQMEDAGGLEELTEELTLNVQTEMDPEDIEQLKKKHRADELRDIAEADVKYLKAMFDKLEKEKQDAASGVSLELGGVEMPVATVVDAPVLVEGGAVDVSV